jgi:hypothetical protein
MIYQLKSFLKFIIDIKLLRKEIPHVKDRDLSDVDWLGIAVFPVS